MVCIGCNGVLFNAVKKPRSGGFIEGYKCRQCGCGHIMPVEITKDYFEKKDKVYNNKKEKSEE